MWFWWFILICDCLIPAIMIIAGRMMWKHCPKKINGVVGYRTKMSMINMDTWRFAHDHAGKLWWKVGIGLLGPTMLIHIPFYGASDDTIGILSIIIIVIQLVFLIGSIFPTEKSLKNNCNSVQREHDKKLNNGLPILHMIPPYRDYGRYFCIMAEKGGTM